jgi:hypothetical protein
MICEFLTEKMRIVLLGVGIKGTKNGKTQIPL